MAYVKGTTAIKKNCYEIYLAPHNAALDVDWGTDFAGGDAISRASLLTAGSTQWGSDVDYTTAADWGAIGKLEAEPTATTEAGEVVKLNDCNDYHASAIINVSLVDLQSTGANLLSLIGLFENGAVDILYYDANNEGASVIIRNIRLNVFPQITGNALNKNNITGSKECGALSDNMKILAATQFQA